MSGVAVVAMVFSGAVLDVALPGVAVVDVTLPGVAVVTMVLPGAVVTMVLWWPWCCCGDHGVAVVAMALLVLLWRPWHCLVLLW